MELGNVAFLEEEAIVSPQRVLCLVLLIGFLSGRANSEDARADSPLGRRLADFSLTSLEGKEIRLSQFQGKRPVLLVFGSST